MTQLLDAQGRQRGGYFLLPVEGIDPNRCASVATDSGEAGSFTAATAPWSSAVGVCPDLIPFTLRLEADWPALEDIITDDPMLIRFDMDAIDETRRIPKL